MGKIRKCGNCGKEMEFLGEEQIQLGQTGLLLGHLSNLLRLRSGSARAAARSSSTGRAAPRSGGRRDICPR